MAHTYSAKSITTYRRCPREYRYMYIDHIVPSKSATPALEFGIAWGKTMEIYAKNGSMYHTNALAPFDGLPPYARAMGRAMFYGYVTKYTANQSFKITNTELEFGFTYMPQGELGSVYKFIGRFDAVTNDSIIEYKTTSSNVGPGSSYWQRMKLDTQMGLYAIAGMRNYPGFKGVIYDVVKKPVIKPLKAGKKRKTDETPEQYEARCVDYIIQNANDIYARSALMKPAPEAILDLTQTCRAIETSRARDEFPRNPDSCVRYNRMCDYFSMCTGTALPHEFILNTERLVRK